MGKLAPYLLSAFAVACCPGPFCEGGPGMCGGLEGDYSLSIDDRDGACGDLPETTHLRVAPTSTGYALHAAWLHECTLAAVRPGSCQYEARCEAVVNGHLEPLGMRVTRNGSGFYGPAEVGTSCKLELDTGAP